MGFFRAVKFSPKILGMNVGMFGPVFEQSGTEFQTVIGLCAVSMCYCWKNE